MLFLFVILVGCNKPDEASEFKISSLSQTSGQLAGGTTITINGSNFSFVDGVTFDGLPCTDLSVLSTSQITCTVPAHAAGVVEVVVFGRIGRSAATNYTYSTQAPTISSFTPLRSALAGGTTLNIYGTGFVAGVNVTVGGSACTSAVLVSSARIDCTLPAKADGTHSVIVTNSDGLSVTATDVLTYQTIPVVSSVSPTSGVLAGGGTLTITGSDFLTGAVVRVGFTTCASPIVNGAGTSITCTLPAKTAGTYAVSVTNTNLKTGSLAGGYTYNAKPVVVGASPAYDLVAGGDSITISGSYFNSGAVASIGATPCVTTTFVNSTTLNCITAGGAADDYSISVTNPDTQSGSLPDSFTYRLSPTVASVSPTSGAEVGGGTLTITGTGFYTGAVVTVGAAAPAGTPCLNVSVNAGNTQITCTLPAKLAATYAIYVENNDGQVDDLPAAYTYQGPPSVSLISPAIGPEAGGGTLTITGTGFIGSTVTVGGLACPIILVVPTSITCTIPGPGSGGKDVIVTNSDGQLTTQSGGHTYQAAPAVTGVSPIAGSELIGTPLTISGTGFLTGATVNAQACNPATVTIVSATSITCTTPLGAAGDVVVTVTNTDTQFSSAGAYTYLAQPTVDAAQIGVGPLGGGTAVTITGTGFFAGATVDFEGSACTPVVLSGSTSLTCTTSAHAFGAVVVTVKNIDNQEGDSPGAVFTYQKPPFITNISPSIGPVAGGTIITITGTDFEPGAVEVEIDGQACVLSPPVATSTVITCVVPPYVPVPPLVAGPVAVKVKNTSDNQVHTVATGFVYLPLPVISGVSPSSGPLTGLTTITINGTGLFVGATVTVDGVPCTSPTVVSSTSMTCVLPGPALAGSYDVVITNPDGQAVTAGDAYTYQGPPSVTSISPGSGPLAGNTGVQVVGTGFLDGATVTIGGIDCTNVVFVDDLTLICTTPDNVAGSYDIQVTNPDGQQSVPAVGLYTYQGSPTVSGVDIDAGPLGGGTTLTITGSGFLFGATVKIGGTTCASLSVDPTVITCATAAKAAGTYDIVVSNVDLQTGTLPTSYTYQAAPSVASILPVAGPLLGGTTLTITGAGFLAGATVIVNVATACTNPVVVDATTMTCTLPSMAAGVYAIKVTNPDTQPGSLPASYTYQAAPTVALADPDNGPIAGGTLINITGTGFLANATVTIGGTSCTGVTVLNTTSISCTTQTKVAGAYTIKVTNTDSQNGTSVTTFDYQAAPSVTSVSPNGGSVLGNTNVTITGAGFLGSPTVNFGGSSCGSVAVVDSNTITCTTSLHAAGAVTVTVQNEDLQTGFATSAFTYRNAPTVASVLANTGLQAGGTAISITGTGFLSGAVAYFGASPCTQVTFVSATQLNCTTPANGAGAVAVSVLNPDGQTGSTPGAFTYTAVPIISFQVGLMSPNPPDPDSYGSTTTNVTHTFTVINTGEGPSTALTVSKTGANQAAYLFGTDNCTSVILNPAETCTVQLTFIGAFLTTGTYTATLNVTATSGGTDTNVVNGAVP